MKIRARDFTLAGSRSLIAAAVATALAGPTMVWAQTSDATLRGTAPANAEVTATNIATGATRRTRANAAGSYVLVGLQPGTYRVNAGPGTETVVTVSVATTSTLDLAAAAATEEAPAELGSVDVSATRLAEMKTSEIAGYVSQHQIETVPQITRNFLEFADNVPGMLFNVDQNGNTTLRGGAMTTSSTNVFIDGIGQKNYVKEGGVTGQSDSQGNPFPQLAIGEYKVITSNYKAQYDQVSSAAITAETRSGTNEFESAAFYTFTDDGLRERTPRERADDEKVASESNEYGISFGGPIIKDKLHYFVTYEAKRFDTPIVVVPGVIGVDQFLPADVVSQFGNSTVSFEEDLFFAKLDWELGYNDRIELSGRIRDESKIGNFGNEIAESAGLDTRNDDNRFAARWQHSADTWFNDLVFTYEDAFFNPTSQGSGNGFAYTWQPQQDRTIIKVGPADPRGTQNKGQKAQGIQNDFTYTGIAGHTFQAGIKYKEAELTAQDAGLGNPQFTFNVDPVNGVSPEPYKVFFTLPVEGLSPVAVSENRQFGIYLQDDWEVNDRLTLNLGVRWDYEETPSYLDYVTPANVIEAFNSEHGRGAPAGQTYAESLALGGVDIDDYFSNGNNRDADTDNIQPRLGFSFDLTGDEKHVLFGGAGRSYDRNLFQWIQLEVTKGTLQNFEIRFNTPTNPCPPGPTCVAWDPAYLEGVDNLAALVAASNLGGEVFMINNDLDVPYSDQFSLGIRNRLGDWNTSATVARIISKDGFVYTLGNRYPNGDFWQGGSQPWGHSPPGFGAFIIGNNGIETRNTQLLLSAEKPFTEASGWSATFAYTYTDASGNRDINETFAFDQEWIGDYPFITSNAVPKHRLVATGSYEGPWDLLIAGKLTLATPIPTNGIACYGVTFPTGSTCEPRSATVEDTLGYQSLDLQVTKYFDIADITQVYLRVDVLNVTNEENFADVIQTWGSGGQLNPDPVEFNQTGNIRGVPRTIRLTFGAQF